MPSLDQYIAGISSVAALAAALATFMTVREMARQRKTSLKPDLISSHQLVYVYPEERVASMRYVWTTEKPESGQQPRQSRFGVRVLNVGFGAAKQLQCQWHLDLAEMVAQVNKLARAASIAVSADIDANSTEVRILWQDRIVTTHLVGNQVLSDRGHLLPASLDGVGVHVEIPPVYLSLVALQVALGLASRHQVADACDWSQFSNVSVALLYADVLGDRHRKKLGLVFDLLSAGHESTPHHEGQLPTFMQFSVRVNEA